MNAFNLKSLPDSCFLQVTGTIIGPSIPVVNRLLKPFFLMPHQEPKSFLVCMEVLHGSMRVPTFSW